MTRVTRIILMETVDNNIHVIRSILRVYIYKRAGKKCQLVIQTEKTLKIKRFQGDDWVDSLYVCPL
jgi:hypothetical protein